MRHSEGRPDLVPFLKTMTLERLSAYCTAVLEHHAGCRLPGPDTRPCVECGGALPAGARRDRRYCAPRCVQRASNRRRILAEREATAA